MNLAALLKRTSQAPAAPHETIAEKVIAAGYSLENLEQDRTGTRTVVPVVRDHEDGTRVVGLVYQADYRYEEEEGVGSLVRRLTGTDGRDVVLTPVAANCVARFADVNGFVLSTQTLPTRTYAWGDDLRKGEQTGYVPDYVSTWDQDLPYLRDDAFGRRVSRGDVTVAELRARAQELGLTGLPRKKADLAALLLASPEYLATVKVAEAWPAWFAHGVQLVVRADAGPAATIVEALGDAIDAGALALSMYRGPFASGLFLYDARDESGAVRTQRSAEVDWYDAKMADLEPVIAELKALGHRWYFLGKPRQTQNGEVKYWLNGSTGGVTRDGTRYRGQPCGWYTLEELRAEKFAYDRAQQDKKGAP